MQSTLFGGGAPAQSKGPNLGPVNDLLGFAAGAASVVGGALARVPLGWLPNGADDQFKQMGDWMKVNRPEDYKQWETVNAASNADKLYGGNMKSDFNREWGTKYLDESKTGGGVAPELAFAPASLMGALGDVVPRLALTEKNVEQTLGGQTYFNPLEGTKAITDTTRAPSEMVDRVGVVLAASQRGDQLNPVEQEVVKNLQEGTWDRQHALDYLIRNNQGYSRDVLPQTVMQIVADPMMIAGGGEAAALKIGARGLRVAEALGATEKAAAAGRAATAGEVFGAAGEARAIDKVAVSVAALQRTPLAPVFKVGRAIVDPLGAIQGRDTATKAGLDLLTGSGVRATEQAYGPAAYSAAFDFARKHGITSELQSALGGYTDNGVRQWTILQSRVTQLLADTGGERLLETTPDSLVTELMKVEPKDSIARLTTYFSGVKKPFITAEDDAQLADRLTASFGKDAATWAEDIAKMTPDTKSLLHAATYENSWQQFADALAHVENYTGRIPINNFVILNDNILDNVAAQLFAREFNAPGLGVAERAKLWNDAASRWVELRDIGLAEQSPIQMTDLSERLTKLIESGRLHTRIQLEALREDPALQPIADWLEAQSINGRQVWNVGFRPDDMHAWGFVRNPNTGLLEAGSTPFVSHVMDATPAYLPVNDVLTNLLGQVIGPAAAGKLAKPVEAMEVAYKVARDQISGTRLLQNMEQRFVVKAGRDYNLSVAQSRRLFRLGRDAAQLQHTTIQGIDPTNIWESISKALPKELQGQVTKRQYMDLLMHASAGDLRVMGLTQGFTQRIRNLIQSKLGYQEGNFAGRATVSFYREVRYGLNPLFYIQRITDGQYFNILKGIPWIGYHDFKPGTALYDAQQVLGVLGETATARDMAMDLPEYTLRSNFQQAIRSRLGNMVDSAKLEDLATAGARWQRNNQTATFNAALGDIVKESLDESRKAFEALAKDETLTAAERATYQDALDGLTEWSTLRRQAYIATGRILDDRELGLRYIQEMFSDSMGATLEPDGLIKYAESIKTGVYHKPTSVGQMRSLQLDDLAAQLGYITERGAGDISALAKAVGPEGDRSMGWLEERLREDFGAHPDYTQRAIRALGFNWNDYWAEARATLDVSPKQAEFLQGVIAREAQLRDMNPVEYLSQVLDFNLGRVGSNAHMRQLLQLVQASSVGDKAAQVEKLSQIFVRTLDPSAQRVVLANYMADLPRQIRDAEALGTDAGRATAAQLRDIRTRLNGEVLGTTGEHAVSEAIAQNLDEFKAFHNNDIAGVVHVTVPTEQDVHYANFVDGAFDTIPNRAAVDEAFNLIDSLMRQFPNTNLRHVGLRDLAGQGWAAVDGTEDGAPVLFLDHKMFEEAGAGNFAGEMAASDAWRTGGPIDTRWSYPGVPSAVSSGLRANIYHEFGHIVADSLLNASAMSPAELDRIAPLSDFVRALTAQDSNFPAMLSEYAAIPKDEVAGGDLQEFVGELFAAAYDPGVDLARWPEAFRAELQDTAEEFRGILQDIGEFNPPQVPNITALDAPTRDALGSGFADLVRRRMAGEKIADGDVEAVARHFANWTQNAVAAAVADHLQTSRQWIGELAMEIADRIPTDGGFAYSRTQGLVEQLLHQKIEMAQRDAYRLAEMSTTRSWLDRSLNHPVFGLYPSSYMWGKTFPETVKFLSKEPFGFETGVLLYQMMRAEHQITTQREYDPKFSTMWNQVGGSETAFLLDYLTPGLPWSDMRAATPPWAQSIAKNGLDPMKLLNAEAATISPERWYRSAVQSGQEVGGAAQSAIDSLVNPKPAQSTSGGNGLFQLPSGTSATPEPTTPAGVLQPKLSSAMDDLKNMLAP
jgi:hypothetical protein